MAHYDAIIRGGLIHDGTGVSPFTGDIGIRGDRIVEIGSIAGDADTVIDAIGKIVTPGFVDVHTHYDGQATWEQRLVPSSGHGVTTVVVGNCGVGFAPCRENDRNMLVAVMEGVEDVPEVVMTAGLPWNWETFPQYLDALAERSFDIDLATQLPHSALRVFVMGKRGADRSPPTLEDLQEMRRLTAQAIRAGALGVSTSRNLMHRTKAGELAPSLFSEEDELIALAEGLADADAGVFQIIPNIAQDASDEFKLIAHLARTAKRPLSYSLLQMPGRPDGEWRTMLKLTGEAIEQGLEIKAQVAPRPVGILYGLELSFHPFALHPSFKAIADSSLADKVAIMRDPAFRQKLLLEQAEDSNPVSLKTVNDFPLAFPMGDPPVYDPVPELRLDRQAAALGITPYELAYDMLLERDGKALLYRPGANFVDGDFRAIHEMLVDPNTIVGLADGGAHYGLICDGSFPTYFLLRWSRDAATQERISLTDAIVALTSQTAQAVGLYDRGVLSVGMKADINVIDIDELTLHAPEVAYDLPTGGRRLHQRADGYVATFVSGRLTYAEGKATGELPGRLVRGGQSAAHPLSDGRHGHVRRL
ncbi:amidohydrolase family protein [soil metagenome]